MVGQLGQSRHKPHLVRIAKPSSRELHRTVGKPGVLFDLVFDRRPDEYRR